MDKMDTTINIIEQNICMMPDEQGSEVPFSNDELAAVPTLGDDDRTISFKEEPVEIIEEEDETLDDDEHVHIRTPPMATGLIPETPVPMATALTMRLMPPTPGLTALTHALTRG
jgi:hypothetical protein